MAKKPEIFVCEFITGGGLYNAELAPSLVREGGMMLQALLQDLAATHEVHITTSRDTRLPPLNLPVSVIEVGNDPWSLWQRCIRNADLVWLIAPESGGVLERMTAMVPPAKLIGCTPEAVRVAASKFATAQILVERQIPVVQTWRPEQVPEGLPRYVAKPDDGIGCQDTRCFDSYAQMQEWLQDGRSASHVVQPFLAGTAASISMLCHRGKAWVLGCNRQVVELHQDRFVYGGSVINGMAQHWNAFTDIAQRVASAIPGLSGYVGIDVMVSGVMANGRDIAVLEVNPRLTTSYAGLTQAAGLNVAKLVLDIFYNRPMQIAHSQRNVITVKL